MRAPPAIQHAWTADPDLIRRLQIGQACYIQPRHRHLRPGRPAPTLPAHPAPRRPCPPPAVPRARAAPDREPATRPARPPSMTCFGPGAAP